MLNRDARTALARCVWVYSSLKQPIERSLFVDKRYTCKCPIDVRWGKQRMLIEQGYAFDGPTTPRMFWGITGFSPLDDETVLPSLVHDYCCDHPEEMPRVMADGLFVSAMTCLVFNGQTVRAVPKWRRVPMYLAVRAYSVWRTSRVRDILQAVTWRKDFKS